MKYNIIYADPPWRYNDKSLSHGRGAECHYPTMDIDEIKQLPINELADDDCVLFIWGTWAMYKETMEVVESWGFEYKTVAFVWIKKYKGGKWFFGMGRWTRSNTEYCLLAIKGKPKRINANISQLIMDKIRKHSQKPDSVRLKIVALMGDLPRIELFARQRFQGWDAWGNETPTTIQMSINQGENE